MLWRPSCNGADWCSGKDGETEWVSLKPADMKAVSGETQNVTPARRLPENDATRKSSKDIASDLTKATSGMLSTSNELEQDKMEGVDAKEWN